MRIICAKYVDVNSCIIDATVELEDGIIIPYGFILNNKDETSIDKFIRKAIESGEITPKPYCGPSEYEIKSHEIRLKRDTLLVETDVYMTLDYPISDEKRQVLKDYRQALRDVTKQDGFPENIIWPEKPEV